MLFLDGLGAILTLGSLLAILFPFRSYFGLPRHCIWGLAIMAAAFAVYSLTSSMLSRGNAALYLVGIVLANSLYCVVSLSMLFAYRNQSTLWDVLYLSIEALIVAMVVLAELATLRYSGNSPSNEVQTSR